MPELYFHQFVIPVQRNVHTHCSICKEQFGIFKPEHLCKRCYRSVCHDCSPHKPPIFNKNRQYEPHRMCRICYMQSEVLQKYVKNNHLKWGQDSDLVKLWLKKLGLKSIPRRRNTQRRRIVEYLTFQNLWKSFNFSFRQFVGIVINEVKTNEKQITELINIGLSQLANHKIANLNEAVYILIFFLTHCNISNAVYFTINVLQIIEPEQPSLENVNYFLQLMNCSEIQIYKMENIIEEAYEKIVKKATVNVFPAEVTIEIMGNLLIKRQFEELEKGLAYAFYQRKQFICANHNKPQEIYLNILRNLSSLNYRKVAKEIDFKCEKDSNKSESNSVTFDERKFEKVNREKEELLKTIRRQQDQIQKLKEQCRRLEARKQKEDSIRQSPPVDDIFGTNYSNWQEQKNDPYSTQSGEETTYNEILLKKNEEIVSLKKEITKIKDQVKQTDPIIVDNKHPHEEEKIKAKENEMKMKDEEMCKLKSENEAIKNMNKRLLLKMHELSNLLMDKEERLVKESNKDFDDLAKGLSSIEKEEIKKGCVIF